MNKNQEIHDAVIGMKKDISYIRKVLDGNGQDGLLKKVASHDKFMTETKAIVGAMIFLLTTCGGAIFWLVSKIIGK